MNLYQVNKMLDASPPGFTKLSLRQVFIVLGYMAVEGYTNTTLIKAFRSVRGRWPTPLEKSKVMALYRAFIKGHEYA